MNLNKPPDRPFMVTGALLLIYGGAVSSLIGLFPAEISPLESLLWGLPGSEHLPQWAIGPLLGVAGVACVGTLLFFTLLAYRAGQGKNWARIALLGIYVVLFGMFFALPDEPLGAEDWGYFLIECVTLVLLFHPRSSAWFKAMQSHRETVALIDDTAGTSSGAAIS